METIHLVACVGAKRSVRSPAKDLYTSPWFVKARRVVESRGGPWFILSAKHGLVHPERRIAPYDTTLNDSSTGERRAWAHRVLVDLLPQVERGSRVTLLAGVRYREYLIPILRACDIEVSVPMIGLGIGEQLAWLSANAAGGRLADLRRFYSAMDLLRARIGGFHRLSEDSGSLPREGRGVYFFFDSDERRVDSGDGPPVVRVGTHGVSRGARSTLWERLVQHRGTIRSGGGNHRGSVFRLLVGASLIERDDLEYPHWGRKPSAPRAIRDAEKPLERMVSTYIRKLPYLWLRIDDVAGPSSERAFIEKNAIALLSNRGKPALDPRSPHWLGSSSHKERVRESGLWNSNHVDEEYDPEFLSRLEELVRRVP